MFSFFALMLFIDVVGAAIIAVGLFNGASTYSTLVKVAFVVCLIGLLAQAFRNVMFLATGVSPSDADLPLWALKDLGISLAFAVMVQNEKH